MKLAFVSCVVVGAAIGLSIPTSRPMPTAAPADAAVDVESLVPPPKPAAKPVETVLERHGGEHFYAVADVNDEPIRFLVDTGATTVALTTADAERAHVPFDASRFQVIGRGASGDVRGQEVTIDEIVLDGKRVTNLRGVVMDGADRSLLGQNYLSHMDSVEIRGDTMRLH